MKTVLITGGGRGIGRATALLCGARGWSVGINYLGNGKAADETASAVEKTGGRSYTVPGDVSVEADVIAMFDAVENKFGPLDGVVINAGIVAPSSPVADMALERVRRTFDVNIIGAFLCAREAARRMPRDRGGQGTSIVLLSSAASRHGAPFEYVDYASSKAAIETLAIGLGKELAKQGVRVNAVRPGLIDTEIHASGGQPDRMMRLTQTVPMARVGQASEVAEAIVWLLSDASSYTTGSVLEVGGGQ